MKSFRLLVVLFYWWLFHHPANAFVSIVSPLPQKHVGVQPPQPHQPQQVYSSSTTRTTAVQAIPIWGDLVPPVSLLEEVSSWSTATVTNENILPFLGGQGSMEGNESSLLAAAAAVISVFLLTRPPARLLTDQELQEIIQGTNLQSSSRSSKFSNNNNGSSIDFSSCQLLYKASRDGWSATDFHECVDNRGSAVVVARSLTGQVFGGYNPAGWRSTDDYVTSTAAFLWTRRRRSIIKFPILAGGNAAIFDYATSGPNFGAGDLQIGPSQAAVLGGFAGPSAEDVTVTSAGNLRQAKSVAGSTYNVNEAWPARGNLVLTEVEVYGRP